MKRKITNDFDDAFPNGVFAFPPNPKEPRVKIRELGEYCKEKDVTPEELTEEEMKQFLLFDK